MEYGAAFTEVLALFTVLGNLLALGLLLILILRKDLFFGVLDRIAPRALLLGGVLSVGSMVGSLIYSEVVGFAACILCWMQRVFMYPMALLFPMASLRKDRGIFPYTLALSLVGGGIALYQWVKEMLMVYFDMSIPCPVVSGLPSCDMLYVFKYDYVTIPMIALNAFFWLAIVSWAGIRKRGE